MLFWEISCTVDNDTSLKFSANFNTLAFLVLKPSLCYWYINMWDGKDAKEHII